MDGCQEALDKIVPCLNEAMSTITEISKYDVAELKSMGNPPKMVLSVLKCVCILLRVEPLSAITDKGTFEPSYWKAAIGPDVLGDPNLSQRLQTFDREALNEEIMSKVEDVL
jgi:dynein heavy chain, axonemal